MRIIYFLDFPNNIGGSNKVLLTQAYIMKKQGHTVSVVIPKDEKGRHASGYDVICQQYGIDAREAYYTITTCIEGVDILSAIAHYEEVYEQIKESGAHLICSTQINAAVELAARELKIPHLMNIYPTERDAFRLGWLDVYPHYHSADSEFFSALWREGLHIPSRCIRVAYENKNERKIRTFPLEEPYKILSVGGLCEQKNQLETIKFILKCKENGVRAKLTLLGDDQSVYGNLCKKFVEEQDLTKEVIFQGFVMNVEEYFDQSDLLVIASTVESYPGVIVESMARGVPVLSTPVAGVPELLEDGRNGFLAKGYQMDDLYCAFIKFLNYNEENKIEDISASAYETYKENHSFEAVGARLEDYYTWIIKNYDTEKAGIGREEIERIFSSFRNGLGVEPLHPYTEGSLWFLYHISERIKDKMPEKTVIWGAGYWGKIALEWMAALKCGKQLIGFIDSYKEGEYLNYPILKSNRDVIQGCDLILVAIWDIHDRLEIMDYLEKCGKKRNKDYFMVLNAPIRIGKRS